MGKRVFIAALALVLLAAAPAQAELVGEFDAAVRKVRKYGGYTVVASTRVYETSGQPAPQLASAVVHFPRGASLRRQFLVDRFFCDGARLEEDPNPALCENARFASGSLLLDARPAIADPIPADIHLFLASGRERNATAGVVVLVKSNQRSPVYNYEVLRGHLFNASSDRRFGYRLELPTLLTPLLPEVRLSLIEMRLRVEGLKLTRRVRRCVKRTRGSRGRCLRRGARQRKVFWIKPPVCPPQRKILFGADYAFEGRREVSKRRRASCRRFLRRPTVHRRGRIPGAPR